MKIHHNTLKRAAAHGLTFTSQGADGKVGVIKGGGDGKILALAIDPRDALDLALAEIKPVKFKPKKAGAKKLRTGKKRPQNDDFDEEGEEGGEGEGEEGEPSRSVIKPKYKKKYRPHKMTCGDDLAKRVREEFMTKKDPDTGKPRLDFARFVEFAKVNECWVEGYRSLKDRHGNRNNGMIRMNVINRLRAKARDGQEIDWGS